MQRTTRQHWAAAAAEAGISLEAIAFLTATKYPTVYAYARGLRNPSPQWLAEVESLVTHPGWVDVTLGCYQEVRAA